MELQSIPCRSLIALYLISVALGGKCDAIKRYLHIFTAHRAAMSVLWLSSSCMVCAYAEIHVQGVLGEYVVYFLCPFYGGWFDVCALVQVMPKAKIALVECLARSKTHEMVGYFVVYCDL